MTLCIKPKAMDIYRHFKGNTYQIVCIAENSETGKEEVIYRAMYEPYKIYARDLEMFLSPVDREKYPDATQDMRFQLISGEKEEIKTEAVKTEVDKTEVQVEDVKEPVKSEDIKTESIKAESIKAESIKTESIEKKKIEDNTEAEKSEGDGNGVSAALVRFLEASTADEQLRVLTDIREELDERMITSIEFSMGLNEQKGSLDDRYRSLKHHIMMKQRYEKAHR